MLFQPKKPWMRWTLGVILLSLVVHNVFGFILGLSVDEAHYALYGLYLDWSYFDHPPLVGWLQAIPVHLNDSDGIIRFIPETLWLISLLVCLKLTMVVMSFNREGGRSSINPHSVLWWTTLVIVLAPMFHVLAVGLLPDTILLFLVPSMMLLTLEISKQLDAYKTRDFFLWMLLGLTLGLAGLSKYTSLFFALAIPVCLISWHGTKMFERPGFWVAIILATVCISPVLYWNYQHDWISFKYQFSHGTGNDWKLKRVFTFILNQFACYGVLMWMGLVWLFRRPTPLPKVLLSFFIIPFVLFTLFSGGGGSLPHWTAPAWIALSPFAGIGLALAWNQNRTFWIGLVSLIQMSLCILGFIFLYFGGIPTVDMHTKLGQKNPIADLYGWKAASLHMKELSEKYEAPNLAVQNWTLASRVAWYARPQAIYVLDDRLDQFDLWFGQLAQGSDAIVLNSSQLNFSPPVSDDGFESCEIVDSQKVERLGRDIASFDFLLCKNWQKSTAPKN
jgi:4-amino-4-deoxy-L-arabinose transferase-like glycosyltransferase